VDRDSAMGVNKPFRDIALGLAARGICVLRYDKRKAAYPERIMGEIETLTIRDDTIDDALLALGLAAQQPETDPRFLFVAGHSLGAHAVPRLSALSQVPCAFLAMAGPVDPLEQTFVRQARRFAAADGEVTEAERREIAELELAARRVQELEPGTKIDRKLLPGGLPAAYWLDLKAHPAALDAEAMTRPVLVLIGWKDLKVSAEEMMGWRHHLRNDPLASFVAYPTLNHMFVHVPEGFVGDLRPGNVAAAVIDDIARWIAKQRSYCDAREGARPPG
jgi:dienelactone hydrolase